MKQLKTNIDKAQVTSLCADAISELERAVRLFPEWPTSLTGWTAEEIKGQLEKVRYANDNGLATATSIFAEELLEVCEAARKPGNKVAARIELVQAMAMLIRISCHLNDYVVNLSAEQEPRVNPEEAASQEGTPSERIGHEVRPRLGFEKGVAP